MTNEFSMRIRVRYADVDRMSFAYNSRYLEWFEMVRTEFIRSRGVTYKQLEEMGILLPVSEAYCHYKKPAIYDELITVFSVIREASRIKVTFDYRIEGEDGRTIASGWTTHPFVSAEGRPVRVSDSILEMLK